MLGLGACQSSSAKDMMVAQNVLLVYDLLHTELDKRVLCDVLYEDYNFIR